jgi:hypothetical protein
MNTPSFSFTASERVAPSVSLNFTTASLDPRVTFTRADNTATVINSNGKIVPINADLPRFNYNIVTGGLCNGLLIEEARTNKQTSYNFNPIAISGIIQGYIKSGAVVATLSIESDADELTAAGLDVLCSDLNVVKLDNSLGTTNANAEIVGATGNTNQHTLSVWVRGTGNCRIRTSTATGVQSALTTSYVRRVVTVTPGATDRMWVTASPGAIVYFIGAQLEEGSFVTSLIPTSGADATRNADNAVMTGANFSDWYNATKGTFRVDAISLASGNRPIISADDNTADNSITVFTDGATPKLKVTESSAEVANVSAGTVTANTNMFAYVSYDVDFFGIARPSARQIDTSGAVPTVDRLRIGADQAGNYFNNTIQQIQFWP